MDAGYNSGWCYRVSTKGIFPLAIRKIAQLDAVQSVHELLVIDWKNSVVLGKDNTVYVSTINGGYVSGLLKVMFMMLKWLITIKGAQ